jgi:hypothetical protein
MAMQKFLYSLALLCWWAAANGQNAGVGTASPNTSARLELNSNNKGLLIPRLTVDQRQAIAAPATGLLVYQTNGTAGYYYYDGLQWVGLTSGQVPSNIGFVPEGQGERYTGTVSTLAGSGIVGVRDGPGDSAQFETLQGLTIDGSGNLYSYDWINGLRKISPAGVVSTQPPTFLGSIDTDVAADAMGNIYIPDGGRHKVIKINAAGVVSTFAGSGIPGYVDGPADSARFYLPIGVAVDGQGNVYVGDQGNWRIRKISPAGIVTTLAGSGSSGYLDGPDSVARFFWLRCLATDGQGNVYVGDESKVRKISPTGVVSTLAGASGGGYKDGPGSEARFSEVQGVAVDVQGNVYVAEKNRIRRVRPGGYVTTLTGTSAGFANGPLAAGQFDWLQGIALDNQGNLYVSDANNSRIRKINFSVTANGQALIGSQQLSTNAYSLSISGGNTVDFLGLPTQQAGSVIFADGVVLAQNNTDFYWDNNSRRLGLGTKQPEYSLDVSGRMRVRSNGSLAETAGIWFTNILDQAFVGMRNDDTLGIYGSNAQWQFKQDVNSGNISIGTGAPTTDKLRVYGTATGSGTFTIPSDARYKQNILPLSNALSTLLQLRGKTYNWNTTAFPDMGFDSTTQIGFIAQEVEQVLPQLVHTDNQGYKTMNYPQLIPLVTEAVKEQAQELTAQEAASMAEEKKLAALEQQVRQMLRVRKQSRR